MATCGLWRSLGRRSLLLHTSGVRLASSTAFVEKMVESRTIRRANSHRGKLQPLLTFRSIKEFMQAKRTVQNSNLRNAMLSHGYVMEDYIGKGRFGKVFLCMQEGTKAYKAIKVLDVSSSRREYDWTWLTAEERDQAHADSTTMLRSVRNLPSGVVKEHFYNAYEALKDKLKIEENPQLRRTRRPVAEREILLHVSPNPFISNLETSFFEGQYLFMVFSYYPGGTLQLVLDEQPDKRFDEETARFYAAELVMALEFLRENNIAHRDVKPENMLLDDQGHLALADFGLATRLQGGLKTFCGTAEYIAPEVLSEKTWRSGYLDWWAFGISLYQMLAGTTPFGGSTDAATVFLNTLTSPLVFPNEFPEDAKSLLTGILQRDYSKRLLPEQIKEHPYFSSICFTELKKKLQPAPMLPTIRHPASKRRRARPRPRIEISFDPKNGEENRR